MSKPRFPLSVARHFCFRATIDCTGEILYTEDFKSLFYSARSYLRADALHQENVFKYSMAALEFGFETCYETRPGYYYTEWTRINYYGYMYVSPLSETFYRAGDDNTHIMRGV